MFEGSDTMEDPPTYLKGDIVWVKLSSYWWPGEVKSEEDLPSDLLSDFKKPPLVIVKFFDEDSYEYLKHWSNIYPYNCDKKSEFIRKGMAGYRAKLSHMAKFPKDIGTAEEKTNGDPNILSQPEFLPVKKINYDEIFGTPTPKKAGKGKLTSSISKKFTSKESSEPLITHRRFLGNDDYKAYICVQYPGKDRLADSDDEEIQMLNREPEEMLTCQSCSFKTKRLGVMLMHTKMHLEGVYITTKRKIRKPKEAYLTDSETETPTPKRPKPKQRKKKEELKSKSADVFTNLLGEWDDTDDEIAETKTSTKSKKYVADMKVSKKLAIKNEVSKSNDVEVDKSTTNNNCGGSEVSEPLKTDSIRKNTHDDIKNCFDFDEEEEEDDFLFPASAGRKIPRVIPEKPRTSISELLELSKKEDDLATEKTPESKPDKQLELNAPEQVEVETNKKEILQISQSFNRNPNVDDAIESSFKELMEETELPALDDLTQTLKPEQNFHDARTIKFPDKGGTTIKGGTSLKGGTPKKRFVTSFEDFEAGFRKIEDEERRRLSGDKEGKRNKKPKESSTLKHDNKSSDGRTDVLKEDCTLENAKVLNIVNNSSVGTRKSSETENNEASQKPELDLATIPNDGTSSDDKPEVLYSEHNKDDENANSSSVESIAKTEDILPVEVVSRRKFRRKISQLAIKGEPEEGAEFTKEGNSRTSLTNTEDITSHFGKAGGYKLETFEAEIEAIKKNLEIPQKQDDNVEGNLNDVSDQTEMSIEQLTRELEGSTDSADLKAVKLNESADDQQITYQKKTRRKTKPIDLIEKKSMQLELTEEESFDRQNAKQKKHSKAVTQEEIHVTKSDSIEGNVADNKDKLIISTSEHIVKNRRGRSRGLQEQPDLFGVDVAQSFQLEQNESTSQSESDKLDEESSKRKIHTEVQKHIPVLSDTKNTHAENSELETVKTSPSTKKGRLQRPIKDDHIAISNLKENTDKIQPEVASLELYSEAQNSTLSESLQHVLEKPVLRRGRSRKLEANSNTEEMQELSDTNIENVKNYDINTLEMVTSKHKKSKTRRSTNSVEPLISVDSNSSKGYLEDIKLPSVSDEQLERSDDAPIEKCEESVKEERLIVESKKGNYQLSVEDNVSVESDKDASDVQKSLKHRKGRSRKHAKTGQAPIVDLSVITNMETDLIRQDNSKKSPENDIVDIINSESMKVLDKVEPKHTNISIADSKKPEVLSKDLDPVHEESKKSVSQGEEKYVTTVDKDLHQLRSVKNTVVTEATSESMGNTEKITSQSATKASEISVSRRRRGKSRWNTDEHNHESRGVDIVESHGADNVNIVISPAMRFDTMESSTIESVPCHTISEVSDKVNSKKRSRSRLCSREESTADIIGTSRSDIQKKDVTDTDGNCSKEHIQSTEFGNLATGSKTKDVIENLISTTEGNRLIEKSLLPTTETFNEIKPRVDLQFEEKERQSAKTVITESEQVLVDSIAKEVNVPATPKVRRGRSQKHSVEKSIDLETPDRTFSLGTESAEYVVDKVSESFLPELVDKSDKRRRGRKHAGPEINSPSVQATEEVFKYPSVQSESADMELPLEPSSKSGRERKRKLSEKTCHTSLSENVEFNKTDSKDNQGSIHNLRSLASSTKTPRFRKLERATLTGIVSDTIYGRNSEDVRTSKSKLSKSRWDVVSRQECSQVVTSVSEAIKDKAPLSEMAQLMETSIKDTNNERLKESSVEDTTSLSYNTVAEVEPLVADCKNSDVSKICQIINQCDEETREEMDEKSVYVSQLETSKQPDEIEHSVTADNKMSVSTCDRAAMKEGELCPASTHSETSRNIRETVEDKQAIETDRTKDLAKSGTVQGAEKTISPSLQESNQTYVSNIESTGFSNLPEFAPLNADEEKLACPAADINELSESAINDTVQPSLNEESIKGVSKKGKRGRPQKSFKDKLFVDEAQTSAISENIDTAKLAVDERVEQSLEDDFTIQPSGSSINLQEFNSAAKISSAVVTNKELTKEEAGSACEISKEEIDKNSVKKSKRSRSRKYSKDVGDVDNVKIEETVKQDIGEVISHIITGLSPAADSKGVEIHSSVDNVSVRPLEPEESEQIASNNIALINKEQAEQISEVSNPLEVTPAKTENICETDGSTKNASPESFVTDFFINENDSDMSDVVRDSNSELESLNEAKVIKTVAKKGKKGRRRKYYKDRSVQDHNLKNKYSDSDKSEIKGPTETTEISDEEIKDSTGVAAVKISVEDNQVNADNLLMSSCQSPQKDNEVTLPEPISSSFEQLDNISDVTNEKAKAEPDTKLENVKSSEELGIGLQHKEQSEELDGLLKPEKHLDALVKDNFEDNLEQLPEEEPTARSTRGRSRKSSRQESASADHVKVCTELLSESSKEATISKHEQLDINKTELTSLEVDVGKGPAVIEKRGRGRPRKHSKAEEEHSDDKSHEYLGISSDMPLQEVLPEAPKTEFTQEKGKLVPPKKNKWPRRGSYKKDTDDEQTSVAIHDFIQDASQAIISEGIVVEQLENTVIEKTRSFLESNTPDNSTSGFNENEIILPLKKSKRVNEVSSQFLRDSFSDDQMSPEKKSDNDTLSFPSYDDSFMSTSLRNNIEGLIKEIDSIDNVITDTLEVPTADIPDVKTGVPSTTQMFENSLLSHDSPRNLKEHTEIPKCVPPKKKKIELPKEEPSSVPVNNLLQNDFPKTEEKVADSIPQAPKKKMQKLFENSQAFEKPDKSTDLPLMSPLAKKKSFLFHHEEFDQFSNADEHLQHKDSDASKEVDKTSHSDKDSIDQSDVDVGEFLNLPKIIKKRKSSLQAVSLPKKDNVEEIKRCQDEITKDFPSPSTSRIDFQSNEQFPQASSLNLTDINVPTAVELETKEKLGENDLELNIEPSSSILPPSKAEELSTAAEKTPSDVNHEAIKDNSSQLPAKVEKEPVISLKDEIVVKSEEIVTPLVPHVLGSTTKEPELIPLSVTPTIMSEKDLADAQVEITTDKVISEKKPTNLRTFTMDFPEHGPKSEVMKHVKKENDGKSKISETIGTEFTSKAMLKEIDNRALTSQPNAYILKSELLDILEGNSNSSTNSSGSEQKFKTSFDNYDKKSTVQGIIDFEDAIPSQIVLSNKVSAESVLMDSPKLLERLSMSTEASKAKTPKMVIQSEIKVPESLSKTIMTKIGKPSGIPKPGQKIVIKTSRTPIGSVPKQSGGKPIILSEQIIRPANAATALVKVAVQQQGIKRQYEDIEDVETAFIIPKIAKKVAEEETVVATPPEKPGRSRGSKNSGKAKILQQTIITPKGEIIPQSPAATVAQTTQLQAIQVQAHDDSVFDINSMPIVLSDDLLTPESIQNMPVVLSEDVLPPNASVPATKPQEKLIATLPKKIVSTLGAKQIIFKTTQPASTTSVPAKHAGRARILSTSVATAHTKVSKPGATALLATGTTPDGKPAKYVLVPPSVTPATTQIKAVKQAIVKKQPVVQSKLPTSAVTPVADAASQIVGNKIMIVTNAQGQQTRVVLTPQQHKAFMQAQTGSKTKTIIKGAIPKALLESATATVTAGPSGVVPKTVTATPQTISPAVSSHGGLLMPAVKSVKAPVPPKKITQRTPSKPQKTILIKNQLGQTVRKIQGTDDADLDRQVAEQLEAIKASARLQQANKSPEIINYTNRQIPTTNRTAIRRSYSKKVDPAKVKTPTSTPQEDTQKTQETLPALAPLSPQPRISQVQSQVSQSISKQTAVKKVELPAPSPVSKSMDTVVQKQQTTVPVKPDNKQSSTIPSKDIESKRPDSPLRQVVIQDGLGNLTTVAVGQILAIPSETVDGQPQSYMLVTVDESGNLTPLNNDALMSLDPSLGAAGDINNVVLQVDHGQGTVASIKPAETTTPAVATAPVEEKKKVEEPLISETPKPPRPVKETKAVLAEQPKSQEVPVAVEQQIVIGEGVLPGDAGGQQLIVTGDPIATQKFLESLSDGSTDLANILANAEGGSVLIQADGQQILIRTNPPTQPMMGITESTEGGGNPMFATHKPNQDILAAALANTDVFQPTDPQGSQSALIKSLQSSQLSPGGGAALYPMHVGNVLETSLTLSSPIMTPLEVPSTNSKKIDDEIDILNQVPKNVDLPITITDPNISQTVAQQAANLMELSLPISETGPSADIHSPSYSYSLSALDESVGISQKPFSSSMPLLTEDVGEVESNTSSNSDRIRVRKGLERVASSFSPSFGSLPMLSESIESSREEVVKTSTFGDIGSLPILTDDVIEDSGSSIGSTKLPRSSPKPIERDIVDEGLSTLGGEMCSSLSEPPPDMFDLSSITHKEEEISSDMSSIPEPETLSINSDNSGEIPIQPPIVANLNDLKRSSDESDGSDEKRPRFD